MNKILLTGSGGFLGRILVNSLTISGKKVSSLSQSKGDYKYNLTTQVPHFNEQSELVIHTAGKAHLNPKTQEEEKEFFDVNLNGTQNLVHGLETSGLPSAFIFISTVSVYGVDMGENINEDHPMNGNSPYADSKKKAEEFLIQWGKAKGVIVGILRLPLIAGPNPPGNLGAMIDGIKRNRYFGIKNNAARKSMVNAKDIESILEPLATKGGIYNLSDGYHPSVSELEEVIGMSLDKKIKKIPMVAAKVVSSIGDIVGNSFPVNSKILSKLTSTLTFSDEKARKELGWKPTPVLDHLSEIL